MSNVLYECDAEKNVECSKTKCHINGGECDKTSKPQYAKKDGKAYLIVPVDEGELDEVEGVDNAEQRD